MIGGTSGWWPAAAAAAGTAGGPAALAKPAAMAAPVAVFGKDDRGPMPPQYLKVQEAIGVLFNIRSRSVCTAFCVAETMVATASHCLFKTKGEKPPKLTDFWFARNYDTVRDYARIAGHNIGAAGQNVLAGQTQLSTSPPIDATSDWALVRLARPVCSKGVLKVEALPIEEIVKAGQAQRVFQIAYHRDYQQWRPAYSKPCVIGREFEAAPWSAVSADFSNPEALLLHTCDTGGASSGSPLLMDTKDGPKVVAMNVGTYVQSKVLMRDGKVSQRMRPETIANTAIAASGFDDKLKAFLAARVLMTAVQIKDVQERLKLRGQYDGPIDGTYGPGLREAIEAFEAGQKRPRTGIASESLLKQLRETPLAEKTR